MRCAWFVLAILAGCGESECEDCGTWVTLHVKSDEPVDRIVVVAGEVGSIGSRAPLRSRALVGEPAVGAAIEVYGYQPKSVDLDPPGTSATFEYGAVFSFPADFRVVAIGYRRDENGVERMVTAGAGQHEGIDSGSFTASMTAGKLSEIEIWGSRPCARVDNRYFIAGGDEDCDGFPTATDCNPRTFCDPDATDPVQQAACSAETCKPCLDTATCTLGSHAVCRDGQPLGCDGGAGCGPAACLPGDACQLGCERPWPDTSPIDCLQQAFRVGAASPEVLHCHMPTNFKQGASWGCPNDASTIAVALPFASCGSPRLLLGGGIFVLAMEPPCTLRITLPENTNGGSQEVAFTFPTGATTTTLRVTLDPLDGTCSGIVGSCDPVPSTATCQL